MKQVTELQASFQQRFGTEAAVYRAPGRVNLIGEHTDYNDGFVMPAAIDFATWVAAAPRDDRKLVIYSENFEESIEFELPEDARQAAAARGHHHWSDYAVGVAIELIQAGYELRGANLLVRGEVPIGSGLSSSAAIEVSTGFALLETAGIAVDRVKLALLSQRAENEYVGMRCGIMDQFISCNGRAGHALLLDCRSLDYRLLPLAGTARLLICNTMVHHQLAGGEYNQRRAECEAGVKHLARSLPGVKALRDVTLAQLEAHRPGLDEVVYRRCRHVITENARTQEAAGALERDDLVTFGQLMDASHRSLRDDYEVSCEELDVMVELARRVEGVYGARMTGGGFGGCTVNLVREENVEPFQAAVAAGYRAATGLDPEIYVCTAAEGAQRVG